MPTITFIENDGTQHLVDVDAGTTARDAAVENDIPGIDGDCGGNCACATCHVFVSEEWIGTTGKAGPESIEAELLELSDDYTENSRLACQITVLDDLDGLVLHTPIAQH
jgi:ferredoxin, 2Fe-2S